MRNFAAVPRLGVCYTGASHALLPGVILLVYASSNRALACLTSLVGRIAGGVYRCRVIDPAHSSRPAALAWDASWPFLSLLRPLVAYQQCLVSMACCIDFLGLVCRTSSVLLLLLQRQQGIKLGV
jgi:hypothetical protein